MNKYKITVSGTLAHLDGPYDLDAIKTATSYPVQGAFFSPLYKRGLWDGRKHLFCKKTSSFPTGLVPYVVELLKRSGTVDVADETVWPVGKENGFELETIQFGQGKFDYQLMAAEAFIAGRRGILKLATNAGKTCIAAAITKHLHLPTLFIVPGIDLLYQSRAMFAKYLGMPADELGIIGDGNCVYGEWITFAVMDSLVSKVQNEDQEFSREKAKWQLLFTDECHTSASDTAFEALSAIPAPLRCGLSGTPTARSDGAGMRLIAQTGEILYEVKNKLLVERGISVQPHLHLLTHKEPILDKRLPWPDVLDQGIVNNRSLNKKLADYGHSYAKDGAQVIYMVDKIAQGEHIINAIRAMRPDYVITFMRGDMSSDERKQALADFASGETRCLVGTSILSTGIDLNNIDMVVLCGGGKAAIPQLQRIGRGLRSGSGRDKCIIVDFMAFYQKHLIKHSQARLKTYKDEDMFEITIIDT